MTTLTDRRSRRGSWVYHTQVSASSKRYSSASPPIDYVTLWYCLYDVHLTLAACTDNIWVLCSPPGVHCVPAYSVHAFAVHLICMVSLALLPETILLWLQAHGTRTATTNRRRRTIAQVLRGSAANRSRSSEITSWKINSESCRVYRTLIFQFFDLVDER